MSNLPPNFIAWHYQVALPNFIKRRASQLSQTFKFFSVTSLLKNLFTPYRRLAVSGGESKFASRDVFDKITFNLTSIFIGATVRLILLLAWVLATILLLILTGFLILLWVFIPLFSLPAYLAFENSTFFEKDLIHPNLFLKKLAKTPFFDTLAQFFDSSFLQIFTSCPSPATLGIVSGQKPQKIILNLFKSWPDLGSYLATKNIKAEEFNLLVTTITSDLEAPPGPSVPPIGQMLSYGYTNTLDKFAAPIRGQRLPSPGKHELLLEIAKVLTRNKENNVLLVGEAGVGRHNTLSELAASIKRGQLSTLDGKRIMLLDTIALAASGKNLIETKKAFEAVFSEAKSAGNIILVIDHIDKVAASLEGRLDLTDVLTTVLTDNQLPIIGITSGDDFAKYVRPNGNFLKLFEKIDLTEASVSDTTSILIGKAIEAQRTEKVKVYFDSILEIVNKSNKLPIDRKQPEKSILLFEDALSEAKSRGSSFVDIALVDEILSQKTKTPVGKISESEAQKLKDLEILLHKRIIGQDEAIVEIARAMRRARAEIKTGARPIGSFLFLGPTGVGKTETAKALAEAYFGAEDRMVRIDMSEFQASDALARLIGDLDTNSPGQLATKIRENPYGLLLVDEFEKAAADVHNLFLQILDEGFFSDAFGKKVRFDNIIIIATSNAGAEFIREEVAKGTKDLSKKLIEYVLSKGLFSPELINRFDGVVVYHPLSEDQVIQVAGLMLKSLAKKLKESKNITLEISLDLAKLVAERGFDPQFGARPVRRLIADKLEDGIAKMIISQEVKNGDIIPAATLLKFLS